jgi:hypothetical protein
MKLVLNEQEVMRAVQFYVEHKIGHDRERELRVRIMWRGKSALVESRRAIPVLTDAVHVGGA